MAEPGWLHQRTSPGDCPVHVQVQTCYYNTNQELLYKLYRIIYKASSVVYQCLKYSRICPPEVAEGTWSEWTIPQIRRIPTILVALWASSFSPGTEGVKDEILQAAAKELSTLRTWTRGREDRRFRRSFELNSECFSGASRLGWGGPPIRIRPGYVWGRWFGGVTGDDWGCMVPVCDNPDEVLTFGGPWKFRGWSGGSCSDLS